MKNYIYQFYNEGLATTFYLKPVNYLNKKIRNVKFRNLLIGIVKIFYTVLVLDFAAYILYKKLHI